MLTIDSETDWSVTGYNVPKITPPLIVVTQMLLVIRTMKNCQLIVGNIYLPIFNSIVHHCPFSPVRLLHDPPRHRQAVGQPQRRHTDAQLQRRHLPHQQRPERRALRISPPARGQRQRSGWKKKSC